MLDFHVFSTTKICCHTFLLIYPGSYRGTNELTSRITDADDYPQAAKLSGQYEQST